MYLNFVPLMSPKINTIFKQISRILYLGNLAAIGQTKRVNSTYEWFTSSYYRYLNIKITLKINDISSSTQNNFKIIGKQLVNAIKTFPQNMLNFSL